MSHDCVNTGVDGPVRAAVLAARRMAKTPTHSRADWLELAADNIACDAEGFARIIVKEGIKTIREARSEVDRACRTLRLCAGEARRLAGDVVPFDQAPAGAGRVGWTERRPVGVIAAITPFNDPLNLVVHKVGPALAAGCAVIVKPHEATPGPAHRLGEAFQQAGLPKDAFQVIEGNGASVGRALVEHGDIDMATFTGGRVAGLAVARSAAGRPTSLEMGGVCSTIVMADADLDFAVSRLVPGMYAAAGQNCLHVQRVIVEVPVYDALRERLVARVAELRLGDPMSEETDMGYLIDEASAKRCADWLAEAVAGGARVLSGGTGGGKQFEPTLVENVPVNARLVLEEVFGPITVLERVDSLHLAVERAAVSGASLAVGIFTRSLNAPFALRSLRVGSIIVNDSTDFRIDAMPFGGPFPAGLSREGVRNAIESMTEPQLICLNLNAEQGASHDI
ncbi:MAG: aldehyde dehydrogenase family protein [Alphaproteobacteria bacterium]|nr:aldehyde dehydrogenase family protein [Alphaproteobacteria bacterium]